MVVVTHEMSFAREVANKVYFMDGDVVIKQGIPQKVLENLQEERTSSFYEEFCGKRIIIYRKSNATIAK